MAQSKIVQPDLPPLPKLSLLCRFMPDDYRYGDVLGFTTDQMHAYAAAAVLAERGRAACIAEGFDACDTKYIAAGQTRRTEGAAMTTIEDVMGKAAIWARTAADSGELRAAIEQYAAERVAEARKPLNFDQLQVVMSAHFGSHELTDDEKDSAEAFARAIERAHGIGIGEQQNG